MSAGKRKLADVGASTSTTMAGGWVHTLTPTRQQIRELDMGVAIKIAGYAGMTVRDARGNIMPDIWVKYNNMDQQVGQLLETDDVRRILLDQIRQELAAKKDILMETEEKEVVCTWIINYAKAWEDEFRKKIAVGWDISQQIITAMHETVNEIRHLLDETELALDLIQARIDAVLAPHSLVTSDEALVRFLFRNPFTSPILTLVAGKILQKKIVCNRVGAYSAKQQRNDVTQETDKAISQFIAQVEAYEAGDNSAFVRCQNLIKSANFGYWIQDHKHVIEELNL